MCPLDKASVFIRGCREHFLDTEEPHTLYSSDNTHHPREGTRLNISIQQVVGIEVISVPYTKCEFNNSQ